MRKYFDNNVARTTGTMNIATEDDLLAKYWSWAYNYNIVGSVANHQSKALFHSLWKALNIYSNNVFSNGGRNKGNSKAACLLIKRKQGWDLYSRRHR